MMTCCLEGLTDVIICQQSSRIKSIGCASLVALSGVTLSSYLSLSDSNNGSFSYPLSATFIADAADIIAPS